MTTIHLVSHTHWDREWYLTFQQFRLKLVRLVDHLLDILATDPNYCHFMLDGQTIVLEDYLAVRPEREAELRGHIQNGRILNGPFYILPDEFLVSPEAHIRNLLEGERTARRYGPKMTIGYIPDTFGHIGQMPQILHGFGIEDASVYRGLGDEPCEFWWEAPNGSRVLMAYLRDSYGNASAVLNGTKDHFVSEVLQISKSLESHAAAPHLLLMHGMDHQEPDGDTSSAIAYAEGQFGDRQLIHSTLPAYFKAVRESVDLNRLPVAQGELRSSKRAMLLPGVLSSRIWIKQRNQICQTLLETWAEPFSTWAAMFGHPVLLSHPEAILRQAWRLLISCHPHDSICGCSIDPVHTEMGPRFDQVEQIGEEITHQSLSALAAQVDTAGYLEKDIISALVVFNPTAGPRTDRVCLVLDTLPESGVFDLLNETGAVIPYQMVGLGSSEVVNMSMDRKAFRDGLVSVVDGVFNGWRIRKMMAHREESTVRVDVIVSDRGSADIPVWLQGKAEMEQLLSDPTITTYVLRARSAAAAEVMFVAPEVPGYGYRTLYLRAKPAPAPVELHLNPLVRLMLPTLTHLASSPLGQKAIQRLAKDPGQKPPYIIENEFFRVEALPDGTLTVTDRRTSRVYAGMNRFLDGGDRGDSYNYSPPEIDPPIQPRLKSVRVECGAVEQTLILSLELTIPHGLSVDRKTRSKEQISLSIESRVTLVQGVPRIDIQTEVENRATDHRLRVHFPAPFKVDKADYDGHFEVVRRRVGVPDDTAAWIEQPRPEAPQRAFTAIQDREAGLLIANKGLPEVEVLRNSGGSEIAITLLRCFGWLSRDDFPDRNGHAGPYLATPGGQMPGRWTYEYSIVPFGGNSLPAYQQAWAFQTAMRAIPTPLHDGSLLPVGSFIATEPQEFILSAVTRAEDGPGWIVRGWNLTGQPLTVRLRPLLPYQTAVRVTLAGQRVTALEKLPDGSVTFEVRGHEIVTCRFI